MLRLRWLVACPVLFGCLGSVTVGGTTPDAGTASVDSGAPVDAGVDAGTSPTDAGTPDAGLDPIGNRGAVNPSCLVEGSQIVAFSFPSNLTSRWLAHAAVTIKNTGTTTWSEADQYRLGSPSNVDPFAENARFSLPGNVTVAPGQTFEFPVDLRAPEPPGDYVTHWQMVKEGSCWFGEDLTWVVRVDAPAATGVCLNPAPPPLTQMAAVVHIVGPNRTTLDSTPKVCDRDYCSQIGFTDGRTCCPPRAEGHPDVDVCNAAIVGLAADTGRVGPTWTFDGQRCGPAGPGNCTNHPTNQFLLFVYGPGTARACGNLNGVCGTVTVP